MKRLRFVMVGGFLGAGKTTTLARLGHYYLAKGRKVGLVTNDQAQDLVDTTSLRSQGFPVEEVPGACFCCRFDDLVSRVGKLESADRPDVILAEPVGSCTDLVATVVQPIKDLYGSRFEVAPYAVLFKPSHGLRILKGEAATPSPPTPLPRSGGEGGKKEARSASEGKQPTPSPPTPLPRSGGEGGKTSPSPPTPRPRSGGEGGRKEARSASEGNADRGCSH
jgi:CobW/HypB/UreG, nucleotide-binding domain